MSNQVQEGTKTQDLLQAAIFKIVKDNTFIGALLQEMTFRFTHEIPSAAIGFDEKTCKYNLYFNLEWFHKLSKDERVGVLEHEILHFLHEHIFRWSRMGLKKEDHPMWNLAADMSINQYINVLPKGCVDVKDWKQADGTPFPKYKSMEEYHKLIMDNREGDNTKGKDLVDAQGNPLKDSKGNPIVDKDGKPFKNGDGTPMKGTGNEGANKELLDKYQPMDEHQWNELSDEEKERMLREAQKLIERTIEKTQYGHSLVPGMVKDLLKNIQDALQKLNYKAILQSAIKKTVMGQDRNPSWKRPNRRYGNVAPGTTLSPTPKVFFYHDTSGSMSYKEVNSNMALMEEFLKAGSKDCRMMLWHTELYYDKKYKLRKSKLTQQEVQAGGTDPRSALDHIKKHSPELAIIFTDGYYDRAPDDKYPCDIIWIITKDGNEKHPNAHIGKTVPLKGLKS